MSETQHVIPRPLALRLQPKTKKIEATNLGPYAMRPKPSGAIPKPLSRMNRAISRVLENLAQRHAPSVSTRKRCALRPETQGLRLSPCMEALCLEHDALWLKGSGVELGP